MLIAIDHGNYAIKTPNFSFVAGYVKNDYVPAIMDDTLKYNDAYYSLTEKRFPHRQNKTKDEVYFILTLFAIAKELEKAKKNDVMNNIDLAVGLPPEHYGVQRDAFASYFKRKEPIMIEYNGNKYYFTIKSVMVFPQAYAAIVLDSQTALSSPRLYIVDIGGYTTDILMLRNGKPNMQVCKSLNNGIITMNNELISKISATYDYQLSDEDISDILLGKNTSLPKDIVTMVTNAARDHMKMIIDVLKELEIDVRVVKTVFIGGGSMILKPYIIENPQLSGASFIDDQKANAIGYKMLGEAQLAAKNRKEG